MKQGKKILVADDAGDIRELIRIMLEDADFEVVLAVNGKEAVEKFDNSIDLVILDIMMPSCNGIDACTQIREKAQVPILFLTAKTAEADMIEGYEAGGDDFLKKPFSMTELLLRVQALLKRPYLATGQEADHRIVVQDLVLDTDLQQVLQDGHEVSLTELEYRIFLLLAENRNRIFTAKEIYEQVWREEYFPNSTNTVMVHIRNIRRKLGDTGSTSRYLQNIWGRGYRIV